MTDTICGVSFQMHIMLSSNIIHKIYNEYKCKCICIYGKLHPSYQYSYCYMIIDHDKNILCKYNTNDYVKPIDLDINIIDITVYNYSVREYITGYDPDEFQRRNDPLFYGPLCRLLMKLK